MADALPPGLLRYAAALLPTPHEDLRFLWATSREDWLAVRVSRRHAVSGQQDVVLLSAAPTALPSGLTVREIDVLTLLALGLTNSQVADRLGTSPRTVSTQVERLLTKLGQAGRAGLAAITIDRGLFRLPVPGGVEGLSGLALVDVQQAASGTGPMRPEAAASPSYPRRRPFLLGSVIPLSGPAAPDGKVMLRGAALAIEQINSRGGVGGRTVQHVVADAGLLTPESVTAAFESLVDQDVDALTSSYASAEAPAALDLVADFAKPYLHTAAFEEQVQLVRENPARYGKVFQTCPSELHYGPGFVRLLDELCASGHWQPPNRELVVVEADVASTRTVSPAFIDLAERSGWRVAEVIKVPLFGVDWASVTSRVHRLGPAAVMVHHFVADSLAGFQRTFTRTPSETLVYCVYGPSVPAFHESLGQAAEGVIWSTVTGIYDDVLGSRFREDYRRRYFSEPGWSQAGAAYDQVSLLAAAWAATGSNNPRDVAEHLRRSVHRGVNGVYYLGTAGQCALSYPDVTPDLSIGQAHLVYQIQGGRHVVLAPGPYGGVGAFREPPWRQRSAAAGASRQH
jgi:branched-chain amino acid transport system substrate-binding protein